MIVVLITLLLIYFSIRRPMFALAMILQSNLIRGIPSLDMANISYHQLNEPSVYFTIFLPFLSYFIIYATYSLRKPVKYLIDFSDVFFLFSILVLGLFSFMSPDIKKSLMFFFKYIFIGLPFYYLGKLIIYNNKENSYQLLKDFFIANVVIAIVLSLTAIYIANSLNFIDPFYPERFQIRIFRITLPGVSPIAYAQAIGLSVIILFATIYTNGKIINISKNKYFVLKIVVFLSLAFSFLLANTRGLIIAVILAILSIMFLYPRKINKRVKYILVLVTFGTIIYVIKYVDVKVLFGRLFNSLDKDRSVTERTALLGDTLDLIRSNPILGIGTDGFKESYPHNIFLDYIVSFGIFGWLLSFMLITLVFYCFYFTYLNRKRFTVLVLLNSFIIYFFFESLISFTIWMHKGLYLSLGLFMVFRHILKKEHKSTNTALNPKSIT